MGKWICGCPDDGVVNGIDVASFNYPLTLFYLQIGIPIYRCRLLSFFHLLVSLLPFVPAFLSLSIFLSAFFIRLMGFPSRSFLGLVHFSFFSFYLCIFHLLVYFCAVLYFLCGLCSRVDRVSVCCCSLRPRVLYISGRKHR